MDLQAAPGATRLQTKVILPYTETKAAENRRHIVPNHEASEASNNSIIFSGLHSGALQNFKFYVLYRITRKIRATKIENHVETNPCSVDARYLEEVVGLLARGAVPTVRDDAEGVV